MFGARLTLVIPPQITPLFDMQLGAYNQIRYAYGYAPSTSDLLVMLGVFAIGVWMMLAARKYLPMDVEIHEDARQGGETYLMKNNSRKTNRQGGKKVESARLPALYSLARRLRSLGRNGGASLLTLGSRSAHGRTGQG